MITYYLIEKKNGNRSVFRTLKDRSEIAILLSPHNPKIPDQHLVEEIKKDGALTIKKKTADIILGEQFRAVIEKWDWHGKKYRVSTNYDRELYNEVPVHHEFYRIGWYRGRLYWFTIYIKSNNNSCVKYPLKDIDTPPETRFNGSWAQLHNFKPVFCVTDKRYI